MFICSIDIGFKGSLIFWNKDINNKWIIASYYKMPVITKKASKKVKRELDLQKIKELLSFADKVVIEKVSSMPNQGVVSMFNFGYQFGVIIGLAVAYCGVENVFYVTSQQWKKYFSLIKKPKSASVELVNEMYLYNLKKSDDGIADGILIGCFFLETQLNE